MAKSLALAFALQLEHKKRDIHLKYDFFSKLKTLKTYEMRAPECFEMSDLSAWLLKYVKIVNTKIHAYKKLNFTHQMYVV